MLLDPVVQVAQKNLQVQHDLVFFQMAFPAQGLCVNRISCSRAFSELSSQGTGFDLMLMETEQNASLPFLKAYFAIGQFLSVLLQAIVTALGGFTSLLSLT